MLGQLMMSTDGRIRDKIQISIDLLKQWEPEDGYYVAFSGGKDSQCVYHLCQMAGVKFDAHYSVTSVDPPELIDFIRKQYPDVIMDSPHYKDGAPEHYYPDGRPKPITMWSLIQDEMIPPSRIMRYCCEELKESKGDYRYTVTGVRWAESVNRQLNQGHVVVQSNSKKLKRALEDVGANYKETAKGGLVLNFDNDDGREVIQRCVRTKKMLVNPIVHWSNDDVWEFLNRGGIQHCCLYDEGFERIGCIGCPMQHRKGMARDFERWPKYKQNYLRAFERMIKAREEHGLQNDRKFSTPETVMDWWMGD